MSAAVQTPHEPREASVGLIVVAASYGGVGASRELRLPRDLPAPVLLVQHRPERPDVLAALLQRDTRLIVGNAIEGGLPEPGRVHVVDPRRQLVLDGDGRFRYGSPGSGSYADPLMASAAAVHGERVAAVVLTGRLDDGARGAVAVKAAGGRVIAQDRATSASFAMPAAAIATGCIDFVLPPAAIAAALVTLTMLPVAAELFRVGRPAWALTAA